MTKHTGNIGAPVELVGLTKRYGDKEVVRDLNVSIESGEFVTLLGPSGSGKTTTLNLIAGFTPITSGSIFVDGTDIGRTPAYKRGLGVVFQHYALFPHQSVLENVMFPLRRRGISRKESAKLARESLALVDLGGYENRRTSELSGGQQQRVALARALVYRPPLLLMDEPLGALDKRLRDSLQVEIKRIQREVGSTCVFVTHDQEEALTMSDRIAVFQEGEVVQFDRPEVLYRRPANLFVAQFLGDSVLVPGDVQRGSFSSDLGVRGIGAPSHPDGSAFLFVRPEQVDIAPSVREAPADAVALDAAVISQTFLGSSSRVELRLADGKTPVVARLSAQDTRQWAPGERAVVWFLERETQILRS
ncbi:ABC transporter ATP-binding protein [Leucobacter tenebrionis]|uniref:ABC transporter ATP-binding protein n=1 Tax=Leucobacter tenebrionis TaxID=2873270 RepID=UPI001CA709B0|nr:ABC transporter ATP-binding protein [Leucobacter tenebrionis]QZY51616.1 ABC transporter ATP-binding protein [Leucobacter tenebrionis]